MVRLEASSSRRLDPLAFYGKKAPRSQCPKRCHIKSRMALLRAGPFRRLGKTVNDFFIGRHLLPDRELRVKIKPPVLVGMSSRPVIITPQIDFHCLPPGPPWEKPPSSLIRISKLQPYNQNSPADDREYQ